jgi:hypothetical protein
MAYGTDVDESHGQQVGKAETVKPQTTEEKA